MLYNAYIKYKYKSCSISIKCYQMDQESNPPFGRFGVWQEVAFLSLIDDSHERNTANHRKPQLLSQKWFSSFFPTVESDIQVPKTAWRFGNQTVLFPFLSIFSARPWQSVRGVSRQSSGAFGQEGPSPEITKAMWMMGPWSGEQTISINIIYLLRLMPLMKTTVSPIPRLNQLSGT